MTEATAERTHEHLVEIDQSMYPARASSRCAANAGRGGGRRDAVEWPVNSRRE